MTISRAVNDVVVSVVGVLLQLAAELFAARLLVFVVARACYDEFNVAVRGLFFRVLFEDDAVADWTRPVVVDAAVGVE